MKNWARAAFLVAFSCAVSAEGGVTKTLSYPSASPTADDIADQVYFVNHFFAVRNLSIECKGKTHITVLASRAKDKRVQTNTLRRFLNNEYSDGVVRFKDIAMFHSGQLSGTGMLITDYVDDEKSQSYAIYLPELKKVRRFDEPRHDDSWGNTDFTFGDVYLRKPKHETHELMGVTTMADCLGAMQLTEKEKKRKYLKQLAPPQCEHKGKNVYQLKSTTKFKDWWYDYRISYVDTKTFADYRTEYFKEGKKIKIIDRDWVSMGLDDPRGVFWRYWYGKNLVTEHETIVTVPEQFVTWNTELAPELWTEEHLMNMER